MKATRLAVAVLLLLGAVSMPSQAVIRTCVDICNCGMPCSQPCLDANQQWTTCSSTGRCEGGSLCAV